MIDAPQVTTPATRLPDSKPSGTAAGRHRQNLIWALALTSAFMAIEVVGGLWTGSLALLADQGPRRASLTGSHPLVGLHREDGSVVQAVVPESHLQDGMVSED